METYVHHTPGRLRIRSPLLKRNLPEADRATRLVESQEGILSCRANTLTGSMLILYQQAVVQRESLLRTLEDHGYVKRQAALKAADRRLGKTLTNVGILVIKAMAAAVLEQIAERSVLAVMGAIR